ncbi:hypothetical protein Tco_0995477 [Tanacetum coccineum]
MGASLGDGFLCLLSVSWLQEVIWELLITPLSSPSGATAVDVMSVGDEGVASTSITIVLACIRCRLGYFNAWVMIYETRQERNVWISTELRVDPKSQLRRENQMTLNVTLLRVSFRLDETSMISLANEIASAEASRSCAFAAVMHERE